MHKYLLVLLEEGAVPFCYYSNPAYLSSASPVFMPEETLAEVIHTAQDQELSINFLYGKRRPPVELEALIAKVPGHVKLIPLVLRDVYPDAILVLDVEDCAAFVSTEDTEQRNLILRVGKNELAQLTEIFDQLWGKFKRLNLHLLEVEAFSRQEMNLYEKQLGQLAQRLRQGYAAGEEVEVNVLSDRLLLTQMNNCDAGLRHLTVAPNGKCYVCPAFYHEDSDEYALGDLKTLSRKNQHLLDIRQSPICSKCDAFHCKRCVYLNKKTTLEFNTPSEEQCLVSHLEREASRKLLNRLKGAPPFAQMDPIPALAYCDPFTVVVESRWRRNAPTAPPEGEESGDLMAQIYEMQKLILRKLG